MSESNEETTLEPTESYVIEDGDVDLSSLPVQPEPEASTEDDQEDEVEEEAPRLSRKERRAQRKAEYDSRREEQPEYDEAPPPRYQEEPRYQPRPQPLPQPPQVNASDKRLEAINAELKTLQNVYQAQKNPSPEVDQYILDKIDSLVSERDEIRFQRTLEQRESRRTQEETMHRLRVLQHQYNDLVEGPEWPRIQEQIELRRRAGMNVAHAAEIVLLEESKARARRTKAPRPAGTQKLASTQGKGGSATQSQPTRLSELDVAIAMSSKPDMSREDAIKWYVSNVKSKME